MSAAPRLRTEYVAARRVLLDALTALEPHLDAVVLIGAQAVYLRTHGSLPDVPPYTTDADLVLDPQRLADTPPLGDALREAGFEDTCQPGTWKRLVSLGGHECPIAVPVDLIVPSEIAPKAGRRAARLPGDHGKKTARKTRGVEGALLDHDHLDVSSLEAHDERRPNVKVAGVAALLVAKAHKLGERLAQPHRLLSKDAGDVYRLCDATPINTMADMIKHLLFDPLTSVTTRRALSYIQILFQSENSPGSELAALALSEAMTTKSVSTTITEYMGELIDLIRPRQGGWDTDLPEGGY